MGMSMSTSVRTVAGRRTPVYLVIGEPWVAPMFVSRSDTGQSPAGKTHWQSTSPEQTTTLIVAAHGANP